MMCICNCVHVPLNFIDFMHKSGTAFSIIDIFNFSGLAMVFHCLIIWGTVSILLSLASLGHSKGGYMYSIDHRIMPHGLCQLARTSWLLLFYG